MIVVGNRPTQDHFSKVSIYNFSGLKKYKKGYIEMTEKIYLETFEKCPGSVYFPLLVSHYVHSGVHCSCRLLYFLYTLGSSLNNLLFQCCIMTLNKPLR